MMLSLHEDQSRSRLLRSEKKTEMDRNLGDTQILMVMTGGCEDD